MPGLGMGNDRYDFDEETIKRVVLAGSTGNYAIGYLTSEGKFHPRYVGRSTRLQERLIEHIGKHRDYKKFKFSYAADDEEAYFKECENYHDFSDLYNDIHPAKPEGIDCKCPRCGE